MVCWKESPDAARAVSAAMPLLTKTQHVVVVGVTETTDLATEATAEMTRQLQWHGIDADARVMSSDGHSVADLLAEAARDCGASLLIMGGYGHWRRVKFSLSGAHRPSSVRLKRRSFYCIEAMS
jgi:nucleotide-binding universal stress UspA family protein